MSDFLFPKGCFISFEGSKFKVLASLANIRFLSEAAPHTVDNNGPWKTRTGNYYTVEELLALEALVVSEDGRPLNEKEIAEDVTERQPHEIRTVENGKNVLLASLYVKASNDTIKSIMADYSAEKMALEKPEAEIKSAEVDEYSKGKAQALLEEAARVTQYFHAQIAANQGHPEVVSNLTNQRNAWVDSLYNEAKALEAGRVI